VRKRAMTKHDGNEQYKTVVIGDYVFTPIKNQFNDKTAYWLSKKYYTCALYCFTVSCTNDLKMLEDNRILDSYIKYFDSKVNTKESA
jgi:hypothetical protein